MTFANCDNHNNDDIYDALMVIFIIIIMRVYGDIDLDIVARAAKTEKNAPGILIYAHFCCPCFSPFLGDFLIPWRVFIYFWSVHIMDGDRCTRLPDFFVVVWIREAKSIVFFNSVQTGGWGSNPCSKIIL